jgi:hypothetical protein
MVPTRTHLTARLDYLVTASLVSCSVDEVVDGVVVTVPPGEELACPQARTDGKSTLSTSQSSQVAVSAGNPVHLMST